MSTTAAPQTVVLDETLVDLVINGQSCRIEAFEAVELLAAVDRRHEFDANECQACQSLSGPGAKCPDCGSETLRASKPYRDDLAAILQNQLNLPAMSGRTALAIYDAIVAVVESKKNGSGLTPDSLTGSELTPAE